MQRGSSRQFPALPMFTVSLQLAGVTRGEGSGASFHLRLRLRRSRYVSHEKVKDARNAGRCPADWP